MFGLAMRMFVVLLGCFLGQLEMPAGWAAEDQTVAEDKHQFDEELSQGSRPWIEPWYRFDSLWYTHISERGYHFKPGQQSSTAFLPLLPVFMASGAAVGLIVPNLACGLGLACFGRTVLRVTGSAVTTWKTCLLMTVYPWAFFFAAPYQESLGFALTAAAILAWLCYRPRAAGLSLASVFSVPPCELDDGRVRGVC